MNMTICYECKHFHNKEPTGPRTDVWYNHVCRAAPRDTAADPVTGRILYADVNDLGMKYFTEDRFKNCRDINTDGACAKWSEK